MIYSPISIEKQTYQELPKVEKRLYESKEDLPQKIGYYLNHEEERKAIAKNGHDKVAKEHTYRHRVKVMLDF